MLSHGYPDLVPARAVLLTCNAVSFPSSMSLKRCDICGLYRGLPIYNKGARLRPNARQGKTNSYKSSLEVALAGPERRGEPADGTRRRSP
jgi:hypothetical protein